MRPCSCRLGSRAGGNCRAWNRRGTHQLLIPPPPGRARSTAAPAALALAAGGQRGPRNPGGGVRSRRRLSIKELPTSPDRQTATPAWGAHYGVLVVIAAKRRRGGRRRPPGLDPDAVGIRAAAGHRDRRSRLPRPCRGLEAEIRRPSPFGKIAYAAGGSGGSTAPVKRREAPAPAPRMPTAAAQAGNRACRHASQPIIT